MRVYGKREKRENNRVMMAVLLVAFVIGITSAVTQEASAATVYAYTVTRTGASGGTAFTVPALKLTGVCCQVSVKAKPGTTTLTRMSNGSSVAKVAYYWGVVRGYDKKSPGSTEKKHLTLMIQYATNAKSVKDFYLVKSGSCKKMVDTALKVTVPETFICYKADPTNSSQDFVAWRNASPIKLTLRKTSTDPGFSALGGYTFEGISYQVYRSDKKTAVGVLTCNREGTTNTLTGLAAGTYYARERTANGYYAYNGAWIGVTVKEGGTGTFNASDAPLKGKVRLSKGSTDKNSINAGYDFAGIKYGVYSSQSQTSSLLATLTLDASGVSNISGDLPVGTRYIREISSNKYYELSDQWYSVSVQSGAVTELYSDQVADKPVNGRLSIVKKIAGGEKTDEIFKFDLVSRSNSSIAYRDIQVKGDGTPTSIDVLAGNYMLRETDSGEYMDETGDQELTVKEGETVTVERVNRAGRPGSLQIRKTTDDSGSKSGFRFAVTGTLKNHETLSREAFMEAISPEVSSLTEGVSFEAGEWLPDMDKIGEINRAAEEHRTGEFTVAVRNTLTPKVEDAGGDGGEEGDESAEGGEGENEVEPPEDEGDGEPSEGEDGGGPSEGEGDGGPPEGEDGGETQSSDPVEIEIGVVVTLDEVTWDAEETLYKAMVSDQKTTSVEKGGCKVTYKDFRWNASGTEYRDQKTGKDHSILVTDSKGYGISENTGEEGLFPVFPGEYTVKEILTDEQKMRYHEPQSQTGVWSGQKNVLFNFYFRNRAKTVPIRLRKTSPDGKVSGIDFLLSGKTEFGDVIRRTGTTDSDGNLDFGVLAKGKYVIEEIGWDKENYFNNHVLKRYSRPAKELEVTGDETGEIVVAFENIPYGRIKLTKVNARTDRFLPGATFSLINETKKRLEATFRLDEDDGFPTVKMIFSEGQIHVPERLQADELKEGGVALSGLVSGDEYRIVESEAPLGYGIEEASKEFTADFSKTPEFKFEDEKSSIETTAADAQTKERVSLAGEDVTIIDTIRYKNLIPGKEYRIVGTMMDKSAFLNSDEVDDIKEAKDKNGKTVTAQRTFKPTTSDGTVDVRFDFDATALKGATLVAYEKLYIGDDLVAQHTDPTSEEQSISMPGIGTSAAAESTGMRINNASENVVITDLIQYTNLAAGVEYQVRGVLMNKKTGEPVLVGGREVTSETVFTPENSTGAISLEFRFDGRELAGTRAVAFEELLCKGKVVAEHKDINDPNQTVSIPEIGTVADRTSKNRIEDSVEYEGLIPGEKYRMKGILVDKKTGRGIEGTASEVEFTPEKSKGKIVIPFSISADRLLSEGIDDVVVFESCDILVDIEGKGVPVPVEVASHRDLDDDDQTVGLREPIKRTRTGDDARHMVLLCIVMLTLSLGGIGSITRRLRRAR